MHDRFYLSFEYASYIELCFSFRGFGLHAGKAVQGAIGSPRKLDATYISESVERAEFLESSTKTYGELNKLHIFYTSKSQSWQQLIVSFL
jgi:hypothetical protein